MPSSFIISGKIRTAGMKNTPCRAAARNVAGMVRPMVCSIMLAGMSQLCRGKVRHWSRRAVVPQAMTSGSSRNRAISWRKNIAQSADNHQEQEGILHAEPEAVLYPLIELGPVVEAADRLEALAEADHGRAAELGDTLDHAHGGNDCVAVAPAGLIQADGGQRSKTLPGQGGQTALNDHLVVEALELDVPDMQVHVGAFAASGQQQAEADQLADDGGPACTGHTQIHPEDHNGVQSNVQHRTGGDAHHGIAGAALEAQLIVQHQGGGHPGSPDQNDPQIGFRVGKNGLRGA